MRGALALAAFLTYAAASQALGGEQVTKPFTGVTVIHRTETQPRPLDIHVVRIDLSAPGLRFKLTPRSAASSRETVRQTTLEFLKAEHAQLAVNAHFFVPFPSTETDSDLVGLAASEGDTYSAFESPAQDYALVPFAPAINIDRENRARLVHHDATAPDGKGVQEGVSLWNVVAGSAQVVTSGAVTVPDYREQTKPLSLLNPGGPGSYGNSKSWYDVPNARTLMGIGRDGRTLTVFVVDRSAESGGMKVGEAAELLARDYEVHDALNLDGGGSTTLAIEDPATHEARILNKPSAGPRAVASSLAVFAQPAPPLQ